MKPLPLIFSLFLLLATLLLAPDIATGYSATMPAVDTPSLKEFPDLGECFDGNGLAEQVCQYDMRGFLGRSVDRWEQRQNYDGRLDKLDLPNQLVDGTDLGINIQVGDQTYYFFGDTLPYHRTVNNRRAPTGLYFGLPYAMDIDNDQRLDWIDSSLGMDLHPYFTSVTQETAFDAADNPTDLFNDIERDFFFPEGKAKNRETWYHVPTGAAQVDGETIYYWYGKYINNWQADQNHLLALDVSSGEWRYIGRFADQKFIQVAPVPVERDAYPAEAAVTPPWTEPHERGFLLYGSGRAGANVVDYDQADPGWGSFCNITLTPNYRESRLYLAYIKIADLERPDVAARIFFYTGSTQNPWAQGDIDQAAPIVEETVFGEFSVRRIPDSDLLMLTHTRLDPDDNMPVFNVRFADLHQPMEWSEPLTSFAPGYGDYVIESTLRVVPEWEAAPGLREDNVLLFARVVSTWAGPWLDPLMLDYGTSVVRTAIDLDHVL